MNRKILLPLATLLAAGAVAVGSGATFTSTSGNTPRDPRRPAWTRSPWSAPSS
jgi:hypothetical protein